MNGIPDKFAQWDAAYVLGVLSPAERREFEEHLARCPACQAQVSELAAIPGLLAQISPADAALLALADDNVAEYTETPESSAAPAEVIEGPPPTLLPKMIKKARARRRRMVAAVAGIAAAVVLVIGGIAVVETDLLPIGEQSPERVAFAPVIPSGITAVADVIPGDGRTEIKVECVYAEVNDPRPGGGHETYSIFVVDRSGQATDIKEWPATPNKQMRPSGTTPLAMNEIANLEIRQTDTNEVLLRASLD